MVYKCFDKKKTVSGAKSSVNEELAKEFHKPVIKKLHHWDPCLLRTKILNIYFVW